MELSVTCLPFQKSGWGMSIYLTIAQISCKKEKTALRYNFCSSYLAPHISGLECLQSLLYMTSTAAHTHHYNSRKILISFLAATTKCFIPSTAQKGSAFLSSHLSVHENQMFEAQEILRMKTPRQKKRRGMRNHSLNERFQRILVIYCNSQNTSSHLSETWIPFWKAE